MSFEFTKGYGQFSSGSSSSSSYSTSYSESDSMELPEQQYDRPEEKAPVRKTASDKPTLQKEVPANARRGKATKTKAAIPDDTGRSLRNPAINTPQPKSQPRKRGTPSSSTGDVPEKRVGIAENLNPSGGGGDNGRGRQERAYTTQSGHRVQMNGKRGSVTDMPMNMHATPQDVERMGIMVSREGACNIF